MRPRIGAALFDTRVVDVRNGLRAGERVTVRVTFRGREALRPESGVAVLERVVSAVGALGAVERLGPAESRHVDLVLRPQLGAPPSDGDREPRRPTPSDPPTRVSIQKSV